jgi:recombination protein RecT
MGLCAFVPYKKELRFMLQYQGVIELARRSGEISSVTAHVVYENDVFDYEYGMHPNLYHKPVKTDRGDMVYAYAIWKFTNGETQFEVMNRDEIMAAKKASQASGSKYSPWNTEFEGEMWKKTVIKRSSKYVPLSVKTKESFAVDDAIIPAEAFNDDGSLKVEEVKVPEIPDTTKPSVEMPKRKSELPREVTTEEEADAVAGEMLDRIADENKPTHCQICGEKTDNLSMNDNGVWVCEDCFVNNR